MRRRIALQLRKRSRVQHFARNQGKRLHGFGDGLLECALPARRVRASPRRRFRGVLLRYAHL
jgi:hypothetical protein